jgi:predicted nucleic acid-binding protein
VQVPEPALFVDTSVWSLAFRRDQLAQTPEVEALRSALTTRQAVISTGLVLQELLQGFAGPKQRDLLIERFRTLSMIVPDRDDHIQAAEAKNACRRKGIQLGTVDALLAAICMRRDIPMLTTDRDFIHAAAVVPLKMWPPA